MTDSGFTPPPRPIQPCPVCYAAIEAPHLEAHRLWHSANGLHAATCAALRQARSQKHTDVYLTPASCDCGVAQ